MEADNGNVPPVVPLPCWESTNNTDAAETSPAHHSQTADNYKDNLSAPTTEAHPTNFTDTENQATSSATKEEAEISDQNVNSKVLNCRDATLETTIDTDSASEPIAESTHDDMNEPRVKFLDTVIRLRDSAGIVHLDLDYPDLHSDDCESSDLDQPSGSGTVEKTSDVQKERLSDFSESVSLLTKYDGPLYSPLLEDDPYVTYQVSNLISTVLYNLEGASNIDMMQYEPQREIENNKRCKENEPPEYLDIAKCTAQIHTNKRIMPIYNGLHIHDLPDDVIHHIFSMFSTNELCRLVPMVCHRWRQLAMDPIHWQNLSVGQLPTEELCKCLERATLLKRLDLGSRNELTLDETILFSRNCPLLQELNLAFNDALNNFLLKIITDKCTHLQQINLEGCTAVDDDSCNLLARLPKLSRINLSHCSMVQTEGVEALAIGLQRITELDIDGIPSVMDSAIFLLVDRHADTMEKLIVDGAELTDDAIKAMNKFTRLVELKLSFAELLTDVALYHITNMQTPLKALKLKKGCDFSTECLQNLFTSSTLSSLEFLDLSECANLSDEGLQAIVSCCGKTLRHLMLEWCWNICDPGLEAIVNGCPVLETLQLVGIHKVKGHCLVQIPNTMPRLRLLDLQQCNQVIDDLVVEVVRQLPQLIAYNYYGERFQFVSKDVLMIK